MAAGAFFTGGGALRLRSPHASYGGPAVALAKAGTPRSFFSRRDLSLMPRVGFTVLGSASPQALVRMIPLPVWVIRRFRTSGTIGA